MPPASSLGPGWQSDADTLSTALDCPGEPVPCRVDASLTTPYPVRWPNNKGAPRPFLQEEDCPRAPSACDATVQGVRTVTTVCMHLYYAMSGQPGMESLLSHVRNAILTHCHLLHVADVFLSHSSWRAHGATPPGRLPPLTERYTLRLGYRHARTALSFLHVLSSMPEEDSSVQDLCSDRHPTVIDKVDTAYYSHN